MAALSLALAWSVAGVSGEAKASSMLDGCPDVIVLAFGDTAPAACAVAWCESRWNPNAISRTHDYGLFQLNRIHGLGAAALDPEINVAFAYQLSQGGTNWRHWSCKPW